MTADAPAGRAPAAPERLAPLLRAALGGRARLAGLTRLRGGSKKGVYRAVLADGRTAVIYIWSAAEDYWPAPADGQGSDPSDPFSPASGLSLFTSARSRLEALGVRTPRLYLADGSREHYPADVAVIEDLPGPSLETLLEQEPDRAWPVVARLASVVRIMHADKSSAFGKVGYLDQGGTGRGGSCEQVVLDRAMAHLAEASARVPVIEQASARLAGFLRREAAKVLPRADYSLIHGELDPGHVLVDPAGQPALIDIEGLMYFDAEWEHVFLRLRLGPHYQALDRDDLDQDRMRLYQLAMHLSLVAGPLRLIDGDFPERELMLEIARYHAGRLLSW